MNRFRKGGLLVLALVMSTSQAFAREAKRNPLRTPQTPGTITQNYADSLKQFGDSLFSANVAAPTVLSNQDMAPLFLPLTFYKYVSRDALAMGNTLSPLDAQLLGMYLRRPDMVMGTQSELEQSGPALVPSTVTEKPSVAVTQPLPQEPETQPVDVVVLKPNFWKFSGDYYLQFLQSYVSGNWYKGGESSYSMVGSLTLEANYNNKQKVKWDNKLEMKLGFQTSKSDSLHKLKTSSDLLRYTGKLGLQASKKWYYTFQLLAYTQFMRGYKTNERPTLSDFMSPLNVNASLGMDYTVDWFKSHLTGTVHLAPIAYNFKYVDRLALSTRNGLKEGSHVLHDFGSQFTVDLKWKFTDNMSWQTRIYGFTSYRRAEFEWENTFTFQFNKYISTKLFVYPRFDDAAARDLDHGYWQFNEFVSLGFSYNF